ncbi:NADP-dependent oxidoreductase [Nocardia sp. NPDC050378]|uniref:NADP-dependent oxidoreductase n=1 Tax=Nocardia sp. NPDC050378 TaxID=3155400 RepID=UPI0034007866
MRAVNVPAAGEQPQLTDLPTPTPGEGTVLVRVVAAGLNPIDNGIASGMMAQMGMEQRYPVTLGRDAAGVVQALGPGVDHLRVGDEVFGHILLAPPISAGTLADYAVLPAAAVTVKPAGLDFVTAAALPLAGAAAADSITAVDAQPGQTILVNGASGGVGAFAVQLLSARGVTVIATGTADDVERLTALGAAAVVDYTADPVAEQVRARHPEGVDALINLAGYDPGQVPVAAVREGGKVASTTVLPEQSALAAAGLTGTSVMAAPVTETIAALGAQAAAGDLRVPIAEVVTLDQAPQALADLAAGGVGGKIVVSLGD